MSLEPCKKPYGLSDSNVSEKNMFDRYYCMKVRKKAKIRNSYNQIPHVTQDTIWESDKNTRKHHMQENQEVSPFPACYHKAARNGQDSMTWNTKYNKDPQKKHCLGTVKSFCCLKALEETFQKGQFL